MHKEPRENQERSPAPGGALNAFSLISGRAGAQTVVNRRQVHKSSFLLHMRPRSQEGEAAGFWHTFNLGYIAFFLFLLEAITGLALMAYYVPSPLDAYDSIMRLQSQVPLGGLVRDLHRLGGEAMVVVVFLHMLRTFLTCSYTERRRFTWVLGVALLLITLGLAFSGYLLPWDQRSYWAVTIGTSIAEAAPYIGPELSQILRGGPVIAGDGLMRFYVAHVFFLPLLAVLFMGGHYYRVSRLHGVSLPVLAENRPSAPNGGGARLPYLPDLAARELLWGAAMLLLLLAWAYWLYEAPLESHADPRQTPLDSQAPWFFLWAQGLLKLGGKMWLGIILPLILLGLLTLLPYAMPRARRRLLGRPVSLVCSLLVVGALLWLSYMGTPAYGINLPAATRILQNLAPVEGLGPVHAIAQSDLKVGVYTLDQDSPGEMPPSLAAFWQNFREQLQGAEGAGELVRAQGVMLVEDWQAGLKKVTLRIIWGDPKKPPRPSQERNVYLHRDRRLIK